MKKTTVGSCDCQLFYILSDSEFFHGKDWDSLKSKLEKGSNPGYWVKKIERNIVRDKYNDKKLEFAGQPLP